MKICKALLIFVFIFVVSVLLPSFAIAEENILERGIAEYRAENYEEALDMFLKARQLYPNSSAPAFFLGLSYKQSGRFSEAVRYYKEAVTLTPPVPDAYIELIEVLMNQNELKEAKEWIAKAEEAKIKPPTVAFLKGLVFMKEDKTKEAIEAFTNAKNMDKGLAQVAEFQIALAYTKANKLADANRALKAVISADPNTDIAKFAKEYEKNIEAALKAYKPFKFTIGASYQYDDNVIGTPLHGPSNNITPKKQDYGLVSSFSASYNSMPSGPMFYNVQYNLNSTYYNHFHASNTVSNTISFIPGYNFSFGGLTVPLSYSHSWLGRTTTILDAPDGEVKAISPYQETYSIKPSLNFMFLPGHLGQLSAGYTHKELFRRNTTAAEPPDSDEDRSGHSLNWSAGYLKPFAGGKGMVNVKYEFTKDNLKGVNWMSKSDKIGITALIPLKEKIDLTLSQDITSQKYRNKNTNLPIGANNEGNIQRKDRQYNSSASILWEVFKNINLNIQYARTYSYSNIEIYESLKHTYTIGFEYRF